MLKFAPEAASLPPQRKLAFLELPSDMKGSRDDKVYEHTRFHRAQPWKIIWDRPLADGRLTDPKWSHLWEMCRRYYCYLRTYREKDISRSTAFKFAGVAIRLVEWLVRCGYSSFAEVPYSALQELVATVEDGFDAVRGTKRKLRKRPGRWKLDDIDLVAHPKAGKYVAPYLADVLRVLWDLFDLYTHPFDGDSYVLNDGLRYSMFDTARQAYGDAHDRGRRQGQTEDVSEELMFQYADAALQYVYDYADDIIELKERYDSLPPTKLSDRARPGERPRQLAEFLRREVSQGKSHSFGADGPNLSRIADAVGIDATTIYKDRFISLVNLAFDAYKSTSSTAKEVFEAEITRLLASPPKRRTPAKLVDNLHAAAEIGLPFTGRCNGSASPWPIVHIGASPRSSPKNLEAAVTDLWTSISIIILAWQADRTGEHLDLDVDCLEERVDGWYLKSRVFKDKNDTVGTPTIHVCPDVVVRAVQVATRLGAQARLRTKSNKLLLRDNRLRDSVSDESSLRDRMGKFGKKFVRGEDADEIKFTPRHLRRFFATLWVHYYTYGGNFVSLQRHLSHASLTVTVLYGRRLANLDVAREAQTRLAFHLFGENAMNGMPLVGGASKKIQSIQARLNLTLSAPADLAVRLKVHLEDTGTRVFPMFFGYCLWDRQAIKKALCQRPGDQAAPYSWPAVGKTETVCGGCANFFTTAVFKTFWELAYRRHKEMEEDERAPTLLRDLGRKGKRIAQRFLRALNA
ncbi:hypothetical protein HFN76_16085 [Rhizobium laguerreae]|nr:hypothetical protein [Rhizobium laguerreae]